MALNVDKFVLRKMANTATRSRLYL